LKRIFLSLILAIFVVGTAQANGYGYNRGYNSYNRGYNNAWAWGGAAFLGGAIVGGALAYGARPYYAPPPVYYAPPPVYYAPPPVYYAPSPNTYVDPNPAPVLYWDSVCQCYR
jgi:hypothetical protein